MHMDAEFWVALGFVIFVIGLGYLGVHNTLNAALDGRAKRIADELAEAKRLREEAQDVLQGFKTKAAAAEQEATAIIAQAQVEAEAMAKEAEARLTDFVARRTRQAEEKIAMAEAQATADVRGAAAEAAVAIAGHLFKTEPAAMGVSTLVDHEISQLRAKLN